MTTSPQKLCGDVTFRYVVRPFTIEFPPPEDVPLLDMCACRPGPTLIEQHMAELRRAFNEAVFLSPQEQ